MQSVAQGHLRTTELGGGGGGEEPRLTEPESALGSKHAKGSKERLFS